MTWKTDTCSCMGRKKSGRRNRREMLNPMRDETPQCDSFITEAADIGAVQFLFCQNMTANTCAGKRGCCCTELSVGGSVPAGGRWAHPVSSASTSALCGFTPYSV